MHRQHIINAFIQKFDYKSYLEIGIENGNHFKSINCKAKLGVDEIEIFIRNILKSIWGSFVIIFNFLYFL